jgi:hypothetical protein
MNWQLLGPLLVTTIVAIGGWFAAHRLAAARDRANKRRDLIVEYLIQAYRRLESCSNRADGPYDSTALESAVADIQLLGSPEQVTLVQRFAEEFAASRDSSVDELLASLREELRSELGLKRVPRDVKYLRVINLGESQSRSDKR